MTVERSCPIRDGVSPCGYDPFQDRHFGICTFQHTHRCHWCNQSAGDIEAEEWRAEARLLLEMVKSA